MLFLQEYIKQRIHELTTAQAFVIHFKHWVLTPNEVKEIEAGNDVYLLTDVIDDVRIESDTGLFDWASGQSNEQIYEHRGHIVIENLSNQINHIPFIQCITQLNN